MALFMADVGVESFMIGFACKANQRMARKAARRQCDIGNNFRINWDDESPLNNWSSRK
jgi:hypothetical protein